ncbi:MAG TPA: hypothetical protein DD671_02695, partial [Balneolaceae bacterium]|nr:hypothetical protein [Balneolaceae bacterium]
MRSFSKNLIIRVLFVGVMSLGLAMPAQAQSTAPVHGAAIQAGFSGVMLFQSIPQIDLSIGGGDAGDEDFT